MSLYLSEITTHASNLTLYNHCSVFCVSGAVVVRPYQCRVFYGCCVFWFILFDQPDVGCGSVKLWRGGGDYSGGECPLYLINLKKNQHSLSPFRDNSHVAVFPYFHAVGKFVAHPPSRIVSHPKHNNLPWPLPAHPPSQKAVGTW